MKLREIVDKLKLNILCGEEKLDKVVTGGYASDLLSNVIANSKAGNIWVTMQSHANIVAVAVLKDLSAIIIAQGREPDQDTVNKAREEHVPLLLSKNSSFQIVGQLYEMGVSSAK